jgi:hypothetical protein
MNIYNPAAGSYTHDMILAFPSTYTTGRYDFTMKMYVPAGKGGYFNLGGAWTSGGPSYEYGADLYFNGNGTGFVDEPGTIPFTYTQDAWTSIKVVVDLDLGTKTVFINGTSVGADTWGAAAGFGVVDIFGVAYSSETGMTEIASNFYVDDVALTRTTGVGLDENNLFANALLSPNPSNGEFSIDLNNANVDGYQLTVTDLAGSIVHVQEINSNGTINVKLNVPSGLYFVRLSDGVKTSTQKMIIK